MCHWPSAALQPICAGDPSGEGSGLLIRYITSWVRVPPGTPNILVYGLFDQQEHLLFSGREPVAHWGRGSGSSPLESTNGKIV